MLDYVLSNTGLLGFILILTLILTTAIILYKVYFFYKIWPIQKKEFLNEMRQIYTKLTKRMEKRDVVNMMEEKLEIKRSELEKYLDTLGTISSVSPLLGLLGTVLGMIKSTKGILSVDNDVLLEGISNALLTTAMGLIIAIPAVIFYNYFSNKVEKTLKELKDKIISSVE